MFKVFKGAVRRQYEVMKSHQLFRTEVEKELLWLTYLESFPPGSNPMFRERTEHDCQACKSFIRAVGSMVAWVDDKLVCLWDCDVEEPYATVAAAMNELVKSAPIRNVLLHESYKVGVDKNHQYVDGAVLTWEHFYVELPQSCVNQDRGSVYAEKRSTRDVFARALEEITFEAIGTVVELIDQDSLYRGKEHLHTVQSFAKLKEAYDILDTDRPREVFTWRQDLGPAVARIRSTAIGTLLVDLSDGKGLDEAVRLFESKVAPQNYQRPKALVTKAMIKRARQAVEELGYSSALGRRFAVPEDITVTNVLFANRDARRSMGADVFDEILGETRDNPKSLEKVEKVPIEKFVEDILPKVTSVELMVENRHAGNFVNLVAPVDPEAPSLFKWDNGFSWCYAGELADSIKARVKAQGGSVTGEFRASLAWYNSDDLDLHLQEPRSGSHIYYADKQSHTGGELDVDMNVNESGPRTSRTPVENITYGQRRRMLEGEYHLFVNNFTHREHRDVGFEVEIELDGETFAFAYDLEVKQKENVTVAKFRYSHKGGITFLNTLPRQNVQKELWGVKTHVFHPVSMIMLSPNHWNGVPVGNRHFFFMLQDCRRKGSSRGFFNEYLKDSLREHRKVFEILGSKMRTQDEGEQLSGLGFSSTQRNNVFAKVAGAFTRTINIVF